MGFTSALAKTSPPGSDADTASTNEEASTSTSDGSASKQKQAPAFSLHALQLQRDGTGTGTLRDGSGGARDASSMPRALPNRQLKSLLKRKSAVSSSPPAGRAGDRDLGETQTPKTARGVTFDPLALLLDAALEGELDTVAKAADSVCFARTSHLSTIHLYEYSVHVYYL